MATAHLSLMVLAIGGLSALGTLMISQTGAAAPAGVGTAMVRVAHLSPTTSGADVWVTSADGTRGEFAHDVTYGHLTPYTAVSAGAYSVSMYPTGTEAGTPLLQGHITLVAGGVYTVAVTGTPTHLVDRVINDELNPATSGTARIRVVQASTAVGAPSIRIQHGGELASDLSYGTVTDYADVPSGKWKLVLSTDPNAPLTVNVAQRSVDTIILVNGPNGVRARTTVDAESPSLSTFTVRPGDSLWSVSSAILQGASGAPPAGAQIEAYIPVLINANEDRFKDPADPNLIFTGQVLVAPPSGM